MATTTQPTRPAFQAARLTPARIDRAALITAGAIFLLALAARLIFLLTSPDRNWPHSVFYEGDATLWVEWARAIDTGGLFEFDLPIHPPAIAYSIAYLYDGVRNAGFLGMKVLWCVMSAAACGMTFLACAPMLNRRIAIIASLLLTFSFNQYVLATSLNNETPYLLLLTALVLLTWRAAIEPSRWIIVLLGVLHGLCMLLRPEHPLLMAMFFAWMLIARHPNDNALVNRSSRLRSRAWPPIAAGVISLITCLPWIVHANRATHRFNDIQAADINFNLAPIEWTESAQRAIADLPAFARVDLFNVFNHVMQTQGRQSITGDEVHEYLISKFNWVPKPLPGVVLISSQGPFSFALANHPSSDGGFSRAAIAHPLRGDNPTFAFSFPPHNRVFVDGWRVGWESITADRDASLRNIRRKFERFADGVTGGFGAANLPLNRYGFRDPVDIFVSNSAVASWWHRLMLILVAAGILVALARRMPASLWLLIIVNKLIITLLFYGYARQSASIAPAFFVFIAIAIDAVLLPLYRRWRVSERHRRIAVAVALIAMLGGDLAISLRGHARTMVGTYIRRPELGDGAFQAFNRIEFHEPFR